MKKKFLFSSILTIAICLCLIVGSTFALFTSNTGVDISVEAGKVNVVAKIEGDLQVKSLKETDYRTSNTFTNGGTANVDTDGVLVIKRMTPGDEVKFTIKVVNNSNVAIQYKLNAVSQLVDDTGTVKDLSEALVITSNVKAKDEAATWEKDYTMSYSLTDTSAARSFSTEWFTVDSTNGDGTEIIEITVVVKFPNGEPEDIIDDADGSLIKRGDNYYQQAQAKIAFTIEAAQANGVDANKNLITTP